MTRHSNSNSDFISLAAFLSTAGILWLAIKLGAPFEATIFGVFKIIGVMAIYCIYCYFTYNKEFGSYEWRYYRRAFRIWPIAATLVYLSSTTMIDQAGTVDYSGLFNPNKSFYHDRELMWYSLWYAKAAIAASIFIVGQCIHNGIVYLWDTYVS